MPKNALSLSLVSLLCLGLQHSADGKLFAGEDVNQANSSSHQIPPFDPKKVLEEIKAIEKLRKVGEYRTVNPRAEMVRSQLYLKTSTYKVSSKDVASCASLMSALGDALTVGLAPPRDYRGLDALSAKIEARRLFESLPADHHLRQSGIDDTSTWIKQNYLQDPKKALEEFEWIKKQREAGDDHWRGRTARQIERAQIELSRRAKACSTPDELASLASLMSVLGDVILAGRNGENVLQAKNVKSEARKLFAQLPDHHPLRKRGLDDISKWNSDNQLKVDWENFLYKLPMPLGKNCPGCGMG